MDPLRIREGMQQSYILFMFVTPITMVINKEYRLQVIYYYPTSRRKSCELDKYLIFNFWQTDIRNLNIISISVNYKEGSLISVACILSFLRTEFGNGKSARGFTQRIISSFIQRQFFSTSLTMLLQ